MEKPIQQKQKAGIVTSLNDTILTKVTYTENTPLGWSGVWNLRVVWFPVKHYPPYNKGFYRAYAINPVSIRIFVFFLLNQNSRFHCKSHFVCICLCASLFLLTATSGLFNPFYTTSVFAYKRQTNLVCVSPATLIMYTGHTFWGPYYNLWRFKT